MHTKIDKELLNFIESLPNDITHTEKLDKIIQWQKDNRELMGVHISAFPKNESVSNEDIAKEMIDIIIEMASGKCEEVDITKLDL